MKLVVFEETGEEREVVGYCRVCHAASEEDVMLVSPQGVAHHADWFEGDRTDCGHDATGPEWWWRT
jgi:hypothetical protein